MRKKITLLDGAVGTSLWNIADKNGIERTPVWRYNIEHPELVLQLAKEYIDAGAEIILANTFGANRDALKRSGYTVKQVVGEGVRICRKAVEGTNVKVALSAGPLMQLLEPYGDLTEEEAEQIYEEQIGAGMEEGADVIVLQTFMDVEMLKIATKVAKKYNVPVICMMTFEKVGKTMMGNSVDDFIEAMKPFDIDAIGMNCSLGPKLAVPVMKEFVGKTNLPLAFKPNAGLPIRDSNGKTHTDYDAATFVEEVKPALEFVDMIGGCCGTDPEYIRELKKSI